MGLIVAAALATFFAVAIGGVLWRRAGPEARRGLGGAFLIALPLQPLAFYLLRLPLDLFIRAGIGTGALWIVASLFYAPLTEEPAKWLVLATPPVQRALSPARAVPLALAIGLGFGIGEIWFLGLSIALSPGYRDAPFWMFNPFILERLEVCLLHGAFLAPAITRLALGKSFWPGALLGVALHFMTNAPVALAQTNFLGLGAAMWTAVLTLWVLVLTVAAGTALVLLHRRLKTAPP